MDAAVSNTRRDVSNTRPGVSNTRPGVSNTRRGVSNTGSAGDGDGRRGRNDLLVRGLPQQEALPLSRSPLPLSPHPFISLHNHPSLTSPLPR